MKRLKDKNYSTTRQKITKAQLHIMTPKIKVLKKQRICKRIKYIKIIEFSMICDENLSI